MFSTTARRSWTCFWLTAVFFVPALAQGPTGSVPPPETTPAPRSADEIRAEILERRMNAPAVTAGAGRIADAWRAALFGRDLRLLEKALPVSRLDWPVDWRSVHDAMRVVGQSPVEMPPTPSDLVQDSIRTCHQYAQRCGIDLEKPVTVTVDTSSRLIAFVPRLDEWRGQYPERAFLHVSPRFQVEQGDQGMSIYVSGAAVREDQWAVSGLLFPSVLSPDEVSDIGVDLFRTYGRSMRSVRSMPFISRARTEWTIETMVNSQITLDLGLLALIHTTPGRDLVLTGIGRLPQNTADSQVLSVTSILRDPSHAGWFPEQPQECDRLIETSPSSGVFRPERDSWQRNLREVRLGAVTSTRPEAQKIGINEWELRAPTLGDDAGGASRPCVAVLGWFGYDPSRYAVEVVFIDGFAAAGRVGDRRFVASDPPRPPTTSAPAIEPLAWPVIATQPTAR